MQIAIDGPAGVGKSTLAKALAGQLGYIYIDTGAMYRGVALVASQKGVAAEESAALDKVLQSLSLRFVMVEGKKCLFNHEENIEDAIRHPDISKIVSAYAKLGSVRKALTNQQRRIAEETSVIMDGRDIGTVVLPNADYKFFITASVEERANRRYKELAEKGMDVNYDELVKEIAARDEQDSTRTIAPLKKADDAILVDTDDLDEKQVLEKIIGLISK